MFLVNLQSPQSVDFVDLLGWSLLEGVAVAAQIVLRLLELDDHDREEQVDDEEGEHEHAEQEEEFSVDVQGVADDVHDVGPAFIGGHLKYGNVTPAESIKTHLVPENIMICLTTHLPVRAICVHRAARPPIGLSYQLSLHSRI